jgi:hypothetical protein
LVLVEVRVVERVERCAQDRSERADGPKKRSAKLWAIMMWSETPSVNIDP